MRKSSARARIVAASSIIAVMSLVLSGCMVADRAAMSAPPASQASTPVMPVAHTPGASGILGAPSETTEPTPTAAPAVTQVGMFGPAGEYDPLNTGKMFNGQIGGTVTNAQDLAPVYVADAGQFNLDLSGMETLSEPVSVDFYLNSGHFDLKLPTQVPVKLTCAIATPEGKEKSSCVSKTYNKDAAGPELSIGIHANTPRVTVVTLDDQTKK